MRAIDLHVHLPTEEWLAGAIGPNLAATEAYFRTAPERKTIEQVAEEYAERDILGVVLDWDDETVTGRPWLGNAFLAGLAERFPGVLMGFGSVDPHRADAADRVVEAADLGLAGLKFHPTMQAFDPADERFYPIWGKAEELGLVALFHTGTCGIGAGTPGAGGTKIRYSHPGFLDAVGADFPGLTLLAAHFGWPWFLECLAIALHKANVWIELSGWAPKYLPPEVVREAGRRLNGRTVFGSDYPFISLDRWFAEAEALPWTEEARRAILVENAARLLGVGAGA
ncbi:MAG TPA: amidohydrolase family protein [Actinomycetota bacterium]|nr:amidohydrolase family protein [Actinomycetota bacterium]